MNIALIIPMLGIGGAERVVSNLSLYLPEDINKYIILYDASSVTYSYNGTLIDLNSPGSDNPFSKIYQFMVRTMKVRNTKRKLGITTAISFTENPNLVNILSHWKEKTIVSVRNYRSEEIKTEGAYGIFFKVLMRSLYNQADLILAVSHGIEDDLIANYNIKPEKIKVIPNSYDIDHIRRLSEEEIESSYQKIFEGKVIINVGRLCRQKGQWHLIRAFSKVAESIIDAKLVILGVGDLEDYLKNLVEDLNLNDRVIFLGFKENPFKYMAVSTLFTLSSLYEGFPNSLAEAMACGLPVVSTDCKTGPREMFYNQYMGNEQTNSIEFAEYGILLPVCDGRLYTQQDPLTYAENAMAECIIKLLGDDELRDGYAEKASTRIRDYSMDRFVDSFVRIMN